MFNLIGGRVMSVTDGDAFELLVLYQDPGNSFRCQRIEQILVASIDLPELSPHAGACHTAPLRARLLGRMVVCEVLSRDHRGRLVSCVHARDQSQSPQLTSPP